MTVESERRQHSRVPINLLVQYRFDTFEAFIAEYARDISESGVLIQDPEVVRPVGTTVYLQFVLRNGTKLIEGLSRVVRLDDEPERAMGLAFIDFDEESRTTIRRIVDNGAQVVPTEEVLYLF